MGRVRHSLYKLIFLNIICLPHTYIFIITMKREIRTLKESKEEFMGGFRGRKRVAKNIKGNIKGKKKIFQRGKKSEHAFCVK